MAYQAKVCLVFFSWFSVNLFVSIVRTIATSPGDIPDDHEWDMPTTDCTSESSCGGHTEEDRSDYQSDQPEESENLINQNNNDQLSETRKRVIGKLGHNQQKSNLKYFTNDVVERLTQYPEEVAHEDYRFLTTNEGPLISSQAAKQVKQRSDQKFLEHHQKLQKQTIISIEKKKLGGVRICQWCFKAKPDRSHHCSQCSKCVLKMDHHCPWVNNCIGFYNYKFFFCMLFNAAATCIIIVATSYPLFSKVIEEPSVIEYKLAYFIVTSYLLASILALLVTAFFSFHCYLQWCQFTTIEFCEKSGRKSSSQEVSVHSKQPYNRGIFQNIETVLGPNPLFWTIPIFPNYKGKGIIFELNLDFLSAWNLKIEAQRRINNDTNLP